MTYATEVLADSPSGFYKLDEVSGTTAADSSGNGEDGTYVGAPVLGGAGAFPDSVGSVALGDATSAFGSITLPSAAFNPGAGSFTIEAWVQVLSDVNDFGASNGALLYVGADNSDAHDMSFDVDPAGYTGDVGRLRFFMNNELVAQSASYPNDNGWHHVAVTWDAGTTTATLYIDGVSVGTGTHAAVSYGPLFPNSTGWSAIGGFGQSGGDPFPATSGSVDEFALYESALSGARIAAHFAAATPSTLPVVGSLTPSTGPSAGGTSVVIAGLRFTGTTDVDFGATPAASFTEDSDTQITAISPAHAAGVVQVIVTTPEGSSG